MTQKPVNLSSCENSGMAGEVEIKQQDEISTMVNLCSCGWKLRAISRELGISRNTVKKYIRNEGAQEYRKPERSSILDGLTDWLKERFFKHDGNADVVRQELAAKGIQVSLRTVERAVKVYRDELRKEKRVTVRYETSPGRQMQADFGEKLVCIGGERVKVHLFTAKLGYSRRMYVRAFTRENQSAWFQGFEEAFRHFGGVPREVLIDNATSLVKKHNRSTGEFELNEKFKSFAQYWCFTPRACAPGRPQTKGKVESGVKYGKCNCLAGREFSSWASLEAHLLSWLRDISDVRILTDREDTPFARFEMERDLLLTAAKAPYQQHRELHRKVSRDSFVDVDTNRYSVPWRHAGSDVRVLVSDTEVIVYFAAEEIARHTLCSERHRRILFPAHLDGIIHRVKNTEKPETLLRIPINDELARPLDEYEMACAF